MSQPVANTLCLMPMANHAAPLFVGSAAQLGCTDLGLITQDIAALPINIIDD